MCHCVCLCVFPFHVHAAFALVYPTVDYVHPTYYFETQSLHGGCHYETRVPFFLFFFF